MSDQSEQSTGDLPAGLVRFEVTVHARAQEVALDAVADLDLDRVPDVEGGVRLLVTPEEAKELVERGYEVRLLEALPVKPLDPSLVMDDGQARAWLEQRFQGIEQLGAS